MFLALLCVLFSSKDFIIFAGYNLNYMTAKWALNSIFLITLFFLGSCASEYINDGRQVCFDQEVFPLIISNCTQSGCHNSTDNVARLDYTSPEGILKSVRPGSYSNSKLYDAITAPFSPMPPKPFSRLTKDQITTISLWIEQGAHTKDTCMAEVCDTSFVSYNSSLTVIFQGACTGCHSGSNPQGGIDLNSYAGVKSTVTSGRILGSINHESGYVPMPQNGIKLSACKIAKIEKWVSQGALNN